MENVSGTVGEYYTTPTGDELADLWPERESDEAWQQVSCTERVRVRGKRMGHSTCFWERTKN